MFKREHTKGEKEIIREKGEGREKIPNLCFYLLTINYHRN